MIQHFHIKSDIPSTFNRKNKIRINNELMIDTVRMNFPYQEQSAINELFKKLTYSGSKIKYRDAIKKKQITTENAIHQNFIVSKNYGLTFAGSLCKYYHGDNVHTLSHSNIKEAIEKLSEELNVDFKKATISRMDLADNLNMNFNPAVYPKCVVGYPKLHLQTDEGSGGIWFKSNSKKHTKVIKMYPKLQEMRYNKVEIPEEYLTQNLLRLEASWYTKIKTRLKIDTIASLYDHDKYRNLIKMWEDEFSNKIEYTPIQYLNMDGPVSRREELEIKDVITHGTVTEALKHHKLRKITGQISESEYRTTVKHIKKLIAKSNYEVCDLKKELLDKIHSKAEENRSL